MNRVIDEELQELGSRLAGMPKRNPFALPEPGYLSGLPTELRDVAMLNAEADLFPDLPKTMPFEIPESYFENLPRLLLNEAKTFGTDRKSQPFSVPENYFGSLPSRLLEAAKASHEPVKSSKSRPFPVLRRSMPWIAAAAVLSAVWFGVGRNAAPSAELRAETALAKLDADSIGAYVERHVDEFDPETLESSLAGTQVTDFRKAVSELRNDEIENYLNDAGNGSGALQDM